MTFLELSTVLGNVGEFVGSIAVLATLVYLAVQVRHTKSALDENSLLTRVTVLDQYTQAQSRWRGRLVDNEDLARIWVAARGGIGSLGELDQLRFSQYCVEFFNTWRASFAGASSIGLQGQIDLIVQGCVLMLRSHRGLAEVWNETARPYSALVVPQFVDAVEQGLRAATRNDG